MTLLPRLAPLLLLPLLAAPAWGQLDLPSRPRPGTERPEARPEPPSTEEPRAERPEPARPDGASQSAAQRVVARLEELRDVGAPELDELVSDLAALGADGLDAARAVLGGDHGPLVLAAARVLLERGSELDRQLVLSRARQRLPGRAVGPFFEALDASRRVGEGPETWLPLLDHPQASARARVAEHVVERAGPSLLPHLAQLFRVRRSETREEALRIAATIDDPGSLPLFLDRLSDRSAQVASLAADHLAGREDERVVPELLARAFPDSRPVGQDEERRVAYALLALVEREDLRGVAILGEEHVPALLKGLRSSNHALSGASALALAGVGFRSERPRETPWLDLEVPHALVKIVSGAVFHSDFSSLVEPAVRRLTRLSGQAYGGNGPEWQAWWTRTAGDFRARRAILDVSPEAAAELRVVWSLPRAEGFELRGPALGPAETVGDAAPEPFYLTEEEALDLLAALRREGLFGAQRLPGAELDGTTTLGVHVDGQAKVFTVREGGVPPWLAKARDYVLALRARNEWQRFGEPGTPRYLFWESESAWWAGDRSDEERARRMAELVVTWLEATPPVQRGPGLAALEEVYAEPGTVGPDHFSRLLELLRTEAEGSARVPRLARLAIRAGSSGGELPASHAFVLQEALAALRDPTTPDALAQLFAAAEDEVARAAALDERPFVRAAAARELARRADPASQRGLEGLVADPVAEVAAAALDALAAAAGDAPEGIGADLRDRVLELALDPRPPVRSAALGVLAHVEGEEAQALLRRGLAATDLGVRRAAARGLAQNATLETVPLLLSLLADGEDPLVRETAREGLVRVGEPAWPDLLRATHRSSGALSRDAALALARQAVPEVASTLLARLTRTPNDGRVAWELAVLTCVDHRDAPDPAAAWWEWWDLVVHDDAAAWLRAALERVDIAAPSSAELAEGTPGAAEALVRALEVGDAALVERARRELSRILGEELPEPPLGEADRLGWHADIVERVRARWGGER